MAEQNKTTRWSKTTVTDEGINLLTEFAAGRLLTITSAYGSVCGTGENLAELTGLPDGKTHPLTIESVTKSDDGVTVCIQVTSVGNQTAYKLEQVGIFAAAGDDAGNGGSADNEKLLMVIEDVEDENGSKGVTVPAESDQIYAFKLYAVLAITNKDRLEVSVSSAGIATVGAITEAVTGHDANPEAHNCIAARIGAMETALNGGETLLEDGPPDSNTQGEKGQHYIDQVSGEEYVCTGTTEEGYAWELWKNADKSKFAAQPKLTGTAGQVVGFGAAGVAQAVPGWSNPYLSDNGYFADPVNQLGRTEYTGAGYTVDRWRIKNGCSVSLDQNGGIATVVLSTNAGSMIQILEHPELFKGKQLTASLLCANVGPGTSQTYLVINDGTTVKGASVKDGLVTLTMTISDNPKALFFGIQNNSQTETVSLQPIAAKLELGSQQTLAHQDASGNWALNDPPPNKAIELMKCQRYYIPEKENWTVGENVPGSGLILTVPAALRTTPALGGLGNKVYSASGWIEKSAIAVYQHPTYAQIMYGHDADIAFGPVLFERQPALNANL